MSNFLQRAAATVIHPQARLQPMLGSIFAPASPLSPVESSPIGGYLSAETETFSTRAEQPARSSASVRNSFNSEELLLTPHSQIESTTPFQQPKTSAPRTKDHADESLLPPQSASEAPALHPFQFPKNRATRTRDIHPSEDPGQVEASSRPSANAPYQPLVAPNHPAAQTQPREASLATTNAAKNTRAEAARRTAPTHEPDEIHIHIGRIEVAAVTQQAPRPAPAPARKSLSLDEYLRRGNGRAQ
jgi:hypothetical protein